MTPTLTFRPRQIWLALLAFCAALGAAAPASPAGTIVDNAQIFSANAVAQAQQVIDQIRARHQKDLNVETVSSIPADQQDAFKSLGKDAFFEQWARQRAKAMGTDGVYVLICMDPRHLQVEVGNRTQTREFTVADRDALRSQLVSQLKSEQFDAGLTGAADFVLEKMDANTRQNGVVGNQGTGIGQGVGVNGGGGVHLGGWLCLGVAVLLVIMIFRRRGGGYGGYGPGNYPMNAPGQMGWGGGGGGGFGRSLLGGILGGALGSWGYDRFERGSDSPPLGGDSSSGGGGSSGVDSSFSGSGGDFGGGGDSGGGGGGDSGGGGGGGDF